MSTESRASLVTIPTESWSSSRTHLNYHIDVLWRLDLLAPWTLSPPLCALAALVAPNVLALSILYLASLGAFETSSSTHPSRGLCSDASPRVGSRLQRNRSVSFQGLKPGRTISLSLVFLAAIMASQPSTSPADITASHRLCAL